MVVLVGKVVLLLDQTEKSNEAIQPMLFFFVVICRINPIFISLQPRQLRLAAIDNKRLLRSQSPRKNCRPVARRRPRPPQQNGKSIMPWSLQYGAMLHLQVMQEKQQQWTNDKLTHLSFFVYYKKNFFVSFCSFFSQKNTLIIIMIINIFIFNHRFTDCFLSFFFVIFQELMYPHHLLSGMKSRNKRKEVGILGRIFLTIKMLRFGSIPSSFQEILPRKCSKL